MDSSVESTRGKTKILGRVVKILSFEYYVECEGTVYLTTGRGRLRRDGDIYIGDVVEFQRHGSSYAIERVTPRRNSLIRPYIANIDLAVVVISPKPEPDLVMVDKVIANCIDKGIRPLIVYNKSDVDDGTLERIRADYRLFDVLAVSAVTGEGMDALRDRLRGKVSTLAGQSAVGKTSIVSLLTGESLQTGGMSRIDRGRNTTRHNQFYKLDEETYLADTCGFSLIELTLPSRDLKDYYPEFDGYRDGCRFTDCIHVHERDCAIKHALERGDIPQGRYDRYVTIHRELVDKEERK